MNHLQNVSLQLLPLFDDFDLRYMIDAMSAGNSPRTAWVDDVQNPQSVLIWDLAHCLYFAGETENDAFNQDVKQILSTLILPQIHVLKIYMVQKEWTPHIETLFQPFPLQTRSRVLYEMTTHSNEMETPELPDGFTLRRIDDTLLSDPSLLHVDDVASEIKSCWTSLERFLQNGFGTCVVSDSDGIVSWCTSEYVSTGVCGIGIETLEAYQGRGLATAAARAFVQEGISRGWHLHWDSWLANTPSVRIAEKVGFQKRTDYTVSLLFLD
jgi:hypothetical protein